MCSETCLVFEACLFSFSLELQRNLTICGSLTQKLFGKYLPQTDLQMFTIQAFGHISVLYYINCTLCTTLYTTLTGNLLGTG